MTSFLVHSRGRRLSKLLLDLGDLLEVDLLLLVVEAARQDIGVAIAKQQVDFFKRELFCFLDLY